MVDEINAQRLVPSRHHTVMHAGGELLLLAEQLPADRRIVGIDLAQGMVEIASKRLSQSSLRCETDVY